MRYFVRVATGAILMLPFSNVALGQGIQGAGGVSCGEMLSHLELDLGSIEQGITGAYKSWMQGYLSARNETDGFAVDISDVEGQWHWVNNYCTENPLEVVWNAAKALYQELKELQELQGIEP